MALAGAAWKVLEGENCGQTFVCANRLENSSDFAQPLDIHLATASVQGWPKLHVEVHAVNALQQSWPVGYGFAHIPSRPGQHRLELLTWKIAAHNWSEAIKVKFGGGGVGLSKTDLVYTGVER